VLHMERHDVHVLSGWGLAPAHQHGRVEMKSVELFGA